MSKYVLAAFLFTIGFAEVYAQDDLQSISEQIKAQMDIEKNLFFTQRSGLTQDQAADFWSLYNSYQKEETELRQKGEELIEKGSVDNLSDMQYQQILKNIMANDKKICELKENFLRKLDKILTPKQKILFCKATRDYRSLLLQKLRLPPRYGHGATK